MMKLVLTIMLGVFMLGANAQDSTKTKPGTSVIKMGNITVVKAPKDTTGKGSQTQDTIRINEQIFIIGNGIGKSIDKLIDEGVKDVDVKKIGYTFKNTFKKKPKKISTNWFVFDIGFAGYNDQTKYSSDEAQNFLRPAAFVPNRAGNYALRTSRVSNFNIWFFMQRLSITKSVLNLKYGLGIESNNYFFKTGITYVDGADVYTTDKGSIFSKNKLVTNYLAVPLMVNINPNPEKGKKGFQISGGVSVGYLIGARQKQKSASGMEKNKTDFNLEQFKLAYVGELGLGPVKLYGSYSMTPLHKYGLNQYPYTVGIRFGN
ncbi:MAG: outer membrane beta-barrel protein [Chitinophagaceae bacterium]